MTKNRPALALPAWARAADLLTAGLAVVAASVWIFGGYRLRAAGFRISVTSAGRVLLLAFICAAVRHAIVRREPLPGRIAAALGRLRQKSELRAVSPIWLASRLAVLAVGFLAVVTIGFPPSDPPFRVYQSDLLNLPMRLDSGWYYAIATEGYTYSPVEHGQQKIAFMPALPLLMRAGGFLIGGHPLLAGQIIVLIASLWGFVYVYRLARDHTGDPDRAAASVALLAAYPFALFFSAVYTESIFLLCAAGGFYHARRREPWATASFGLLAGLARPNGFLLSVPLVVAILTPALLPSWGAWRTWSAAAVARALRESWIMLAAAAAPVLGVVLFSAWVYSVTGNPLAWIESHAAWGRVYVGAFDFIAGPYRELAARGLYRFVHTLPIDTVNGLAIALALVAVVPVTVRYGLAYGLFLVLNLLPPLVVGGWMSMGRVTAGLFPVFFWLAGAIPARHRVAWLIAFATLQGLAAVLFYTGRPFI